MTDLRENVGWVIGGALAAIAAFLGWFYESGLINTIIGIIIGAGIAFFVQTRTQKRAWKREYAIKVVEEIYAPLFKELKTVVKGLEAKDYWGCRLNTWREIQNSHKYLMIDEPFRTKIDELSEALDKYSRAIGKVRSEVIPKIFNEEARSSFKIETNVQMQLSVKANNKGYGLGNSIVASLLKGQHPKECASESFGSYSDFKTVESYDLITKEGQTIHIHEIDKFDDFWFSCLVRIKGNPTVQFVLKENERLLGDAKKLKEELTKRIQEPWNI